MTNGSQNADTPTPLLGKQISRSKWDKSNLKEPAIPADAVVDLRTQQNTLSFWRCGTTAEPKKENIVLAMALASGDRKLGGSVDFVFIPETAFHSNGILTSDTPGNTLVKSLVAEHVDAVELSLEGIGIVARVIDDAISNNHSIRYSRGEIANIIIKACAKGEFESSIIPEEMQKQIDNIEEDRRKKSSSNRKS